MIATLEKAKASAVDIAEKLQQAKLTAKEIDDVRVKYTGAARRGAVLFFVMAGLANVNKMYEYSLSSFLTVFSNTLATSKKDASLETRLKNVIEATTSDVYNYTCLGLFEKHKLMFSFQVHSHYPYHCVMLFACSVFNLALELHQSPCRCYNIHAVIYTFLAGKDEHVALTCCTLFPTHTTCWCEPQNWSGRPNKTAQRVLIFAKSACRLQSGPFKRLETSTLHIWISS